METLPYDFLVIVLRNCPQAGSLYLDLWNKRNKDNLVRFPKTHTEELFLLSTSDFKQKLFALCHEGLINVEEGLREHQDHFELELIGYEECAGIGKPLC